MPVVHLRQKQEFNISFSILFIQVFIANLDKDTVVRATLSNTILAKYIRIHPKTWEQTAALRVEFIGAYIGELRCYRNLLVMDFPFIQRRNLSGGGGVPRTPPQKKIIPIVRAI
jgi:hypothetical protein